MSNTLNFHVGYRGSGFLDTKWLHGSLALFKTLNLLKSLRCLHNRPSLKRFRMINILELGHQTKKRDKPYWVYIFLKS